MPVLLLGKKAFYLQVWEAALPASSPLSDY